MNKCVCIAEEGYRPEHFDPRTSLLVLQDVRVALSPDDDGDLYVTHASYNSP